MRKSEKENDNPDKKPEKIESQFNINSNRVSPELSLLDMVETNRKCERDWKIYYELYENNFTKILREINGLPPNNQWNAIHNFLKKAFSLKRYATYNPQSPLNPTVLISMLEKEITKRTQEPQEPESLVTNQRMDNPRTKRLQHHWLYDQDREIEQFRRFLKLLSLRDNGYIAEACFTYAQNIYDSNFASDYYEVIWDNNKIIWTASLREYHYFYFKLKEHHLFELDDKYGIFFESHFLFHDHKQHKTRSLSASDVTHGCRGKDPAEKKKKARIDYLFESF